MIVYGITGKTFWKRFSLALSKAFQVGCSLALRDRGVYGSPSLSVAGGEARLRGFEGGHGGNFLIVGAGRSACPKDGRRPPSCLFPPVYDNSRMFRQRFSLALSKAFQVGCSLRLRDRGVYGSPSLSVAGGEARLRGFEGGHGGNFFKSSLPCMIIAGYSDRGFPWPFPKLFKWVARLGCLTGACMAPPASPSQAVRPD
jgi:hypothetical protein